jgi:hypothetical protein
MSLGSRHYRVLPYPRFMGIDERWVAIEQAVQDAFADKRVLEDPPATPDDWMWLAATIADHVSGAFGLPARPKPSA